MGTQQFKLDTTGGVCTCFVPKDGAARLAVLCGWEMEPLLLTLSREIPHTALLFLPADGGRDFTPWPAPPVWEGQAFTGGADRYLQILLQEAIPQVCARAKIPMQPQNLAILGYSLGGLFAAYAACSGAFGAAASISGSLWYPDWLHYVQTHLPPKDTGFYFSLGDREPFGGPPAMRSVGEGMEQTAALLRQNGNPVVLEWNRGGHGKGVENRWRKALRQLSVFWEAQDDAAKSV